MAAEPAAELRTIGLEAPTATDPEWPVWRGAHGDGISRETGWLADWPEKGPPIAWRKEIGTGFSSFTIARQRLFTMGRNGDDEDVVYCLNPDTGETLWKHQYACQLVDNLHEGGPGATPTIDGDRVYTLSREGHLFCFAVADGKVLWSRELRQELGVKQPEWGMTCSPLILGEHLIVEAGRVAAFDKRTGEKVWQSPTVEPAGYGSPVAFRRGEETLIAVFTNQRLLVVKASNGTEVAGFPWTTSYETTSATPIVVDDQIFISSGYGKGCALLRLAGDKLERVYTNREMCNHMNNCVLWKGHLYGFDGNSHESRNVKLACMEFATGKLMWGERGFGCGSLLISDGKLLVLSEGGELVIADASPAKLQVQSRAKVLRGRCWTVPLLAGRRVYCRNAAGDVACVDLRPGS